MHIKPDQNACITIVLGCACLGIACALMYFGLHAPLLFVLLLVLIPAVLWILPFAMATCREITMDEQGCTVRFIFFTRCYTWQELVTCKRERYTRVTYKSPYDEAVIFSPHRIRKPKWMKPLEYVFIAPPFSFFFVHFMPRNKELYESRLNGFPLLCCIDSEEFLSKMAEWKVAISDCHP